MRQRPLLFVPYERPEDFQPGGRGWEKSKKLWEATEAAAPTLSAAGYSAPYAPAYARGIGTPESPSGYFIAIVSDGAPIGSPQGSLRSFFPYLKGFCEGLAAASHIQNQAKTTPPL